MLTEHRVSQNWQPPSFLQLPPELRYMVYDYTFGERKVISHAHDCYTTPQIWIDVDNAESDEGELERLRSPYQITGLHHTCRQIRQETMYFNPLFKNIEGDSASLLRILNQPNPFQHLRVICLCLRLGDTVFVRGLFTLSDNLLRLVYLLRNSKELARVSVHGCISFFDPEEQAAFAAIWALLARRIMVDRDLEIVFNPSKWFGRCCCCDKTTCECMSVVRWAKHMTIVERRT